MNLICIVIIIFITTGATAAFAGKLYIQFSQKKKQTSFSKEGDEL
jgi:hypothetical protein